VRCADLVRGPQDHTTADYWTSQIPAKSTPPTPTIVVNMEADNPARILDGFVWTAGDALCYSGATTDRRVRATLLAAGAPPNLIR